MSQSGRFITGSSTGPFVAKIQGNSGSPVAPTFAGIINLIGTGVASVDPGGANTQNVYAPPYGIILNAADTSTPIPPMVVNNGYIANGSAATVEYELPTIAPYGSFLLVMNITGSFGWKIKQASGQQIILGNNASTLGAIGYARSTGLGDSVTLLCVVANTIWQAVSFTGNPVLN